MKIDLRGGAVEFLKPKDLTTETRATVVRVEMKSILDRFVGEHVERMVGYFELITDPGVLRSFILNKTVQRQLATALGDAETDNWTDRDVILFPATASNGKAAIRVKAAT
jgi:hypothetical protein